MNYNENMQLSDEKRLELRIYQLFRQMTIPMELSGGKILFTAVKLCFYNKGYMDSITKLLYPKLADIFSTTPCCIEKNMREAIIRAWDCSMQEFFERNSMQPNKKPSNGVLIKRLVLLLNIL